MEVMDAIRTRHSCRRYLDRDIEEEKLARVLEAGRLAPSARNMQEWRFVVVKDAATRKRLRDCAKGQKFVAEAPVVIAAAGTNIEYRMTCGHQAYLIDVSIAVDHMTLAAAGEGLGTCWIGAFHEEQAREILGIPNDWRVVALLPLGYPAGPGPEVKDRKTIAEIVCRETWASQRG